MPCGEQTIIVKTGSDATNAAVRAARAYTGRDKIARCGYHGWGDWCVENHGGVPQAVVDLTKEFQYGDIADLERVFAENPGRDRGVIITPVGHPHGEARSSRRRRATSRRSRSSPTRTAPSLVFDEIRTGFRVAMGGAQQRYGVDARPDHRRQGDGQRLPDRRRGRQARDHLVYEKGAFLSSTFFPNSLEMAAAMACMDILEREKVQDVIWERGTRFLERLGKIVDASGVPVTKSGIPPMPFLTFDKVDEHYKERRTEFYTQCIRRGLFVQPYHHWYIAYRHTEEDLARALDVVEESARLRGAGVSVQHVTRGDGAGHGGDPAPPSTRGTRWTS